MVDASIRRKNEAANCSSDDVRLIQRELDKCKGERKEIANGRLTSPPAM